MSPCNILILDDDEDIHNFIKFDLKDLPFNIHSALNEQEAIELLKNHHFTYGIFDIILSSSTSSNQVIKQISSGEAGENHNLPLIVMSAHMNDDYGAKLQLKGSSIVKTIKKPIAKGDIKSILVGDKENTILLLEDDPDVARLIKNDLKKSGYNIYYAASSDQAIELLQRTTFMCAIVDNKLGVDKSSEDFFEYLRHSGLPLKLPLILTGKSVQQELDQDGFLFVFDEVKKPFKKNDFNSSVNRLASWFKNVANQEEGFAGFSSIEALIESMKISGAYRDPSDVTKVSGYEEDNDHDSTVVGGATEEDETKQVIGGVVDEEVNKHFLVNGAATTEEELWQAQGIQPPPDENAPPPEQEYDPNNKNKDGLTPVMLACILGDVNLIGKLVSLGADLRLRSKDGKGCMHYAAAAKTPDALRYLISLKVKVNDRDQHDREPLFYSIMCKNMENIKTLMAAGSRTTSRFQGKTYLTVATFTGDLEVVKLIATANINPTIKDYAGKTAMDYAKAKKFDDVYHYLVELAR